MNNRPVFLAGAAVLLGGTLFRLWPIFSGQPALSEFFMTEDGYLLLTVARNIAIGLGMSVSEGTIPTNGVQPLVTYILALPYLATGGDKVTSLVGVHIFLAAIAVAGFFAVHSLARRTLRSQGDNPAWPMFAAALWFLGPLLLNHTMNGLETGLYTLMLLLTLLQFARILDKGAEAGLADRMGLGALCGLTFLARNDGAFLVTAIFALWFLNELLARRQGLGATLARLIPPGLLSLVFAAPWLINNQLKFGSIMPISGTAESMNSTFGQNAGLIPAKLFEQILPMLPLPRTLENSPVLIVLASALVIGVLGWFLIGIWRQRGPVRIVLTAYAVFGLLLAGYYGLFFGAAHFLGRYMAPLAPLLIIALLWVALDVLQRLAPRHREAIALIAGSGAVVLSVLLLVRLVLLPESNTHRHFQVVEWVHANVPAQTWVGAVQTGTLGYWHDRTINLDGKVNPYALAAKKTEGNVLAYVVDSDIDYLADWTGIAGWATLTDGGFADAFELIVDDKKLNLAVLKRRR